MADYISNAPLIVDDPYVPAGIVLLVSELQSDAIGIRSGSGSWAMFANDADYGAVITSTVTIASVSGSDFMYLGAVVRTGPNASAFLGVRFNMFGDAALISVNALGVDSPISSNTSIGVAPAVDDLYSCTISIAAGTATITASANGAPITFSANTTTAFTSEPSLAAGGAFDPQNSNLTRWKQFTGTGILPSGVVTIGGEVSRRRPIGRGPQMNRFPSVFKRSQGSQATRQVLLQLFSSPGVPLANTSVTFYTAYNDAGAAIDGPMVRTTDSSGYVLLVGLNIGATAGNIRYQITGDPTKHRVSAVNFVI